VNDILITPSDELSEIMALDNERTHKYKFRV